LTAKGEKENESFLKKLDALKSKLEKLQKYAQYKSIADLKGKVETLFIQTHFCNRNEPENYKEGDGEKQRMEIIKKHD